MNMPAGVFMWPENAILFYAIAQLARVFSKRCKFCKLMLQSKIE